MTDKIYSCIIKLGNRKNGSANCVSYDGEGNDGSRYWNFNSLVEWQRYVYKRPGWKLWTYYNVYHKPTRGYLTSFTNRIVPDAARVENCSRTNFLPHKALLWVPTQGTTAEINEYYRILLKLVKQAQRQEWEAEERLMLEELVETCSSNQPV